MRPKPRYQKGDLIGDRYLVHQALMGGMGEVYLCLDTKDNLPFALKTFQPRFNTPELRQHFYSEVEKWVNLEKHPNIVRCFFMETIANQPFMFLEWVAGDEPRGTSLRDWLRHGPLELPQALVFTIDLCRGLRYAQQKQPGIVHRDLKPDNVLVSQAHIAKITDFGLATIAQKSGLPLDGGEGEVDMRRSFRGAAGIVGTPPYMPPEQWQSGTEVDVGADIYAVGCILYELLTGKWVYQAYTLVEMSWQHLEAPLPRLRGYDFLQPLLERCLAKRREERFETVAALLTELERIYQWMLGKAPRDEATGEDFTVVDYANRGKTYLGMDLYEAALADYNKAIELDSRYAPAYSDRGLTHHGMGRHEMALADFNKGIELDPRDALIYSNRGVTYHNMGLHEAALADYNKAIELDSRYPEAYTNRGATYHNIGRHEAALSDFNKAVELNPQLATAYLNRGITYEEIGRPNAALADYNKAIELDPQYTLAYYSIAALLGNQGKLQEALPYFEKAGQLGDQQAAQFAAQIRRQFGLDSVAGPA